MKDRNRKDDFLAGKWAKDAVAELSAIKWGSDQDGGDPAKIR